MRSSPRRWTTPLKSFSWRFSILHCRRLPVPTQGGRRKREVNAVLMLGFWSGDQSSNRIAYQRHIIHLSAVGSFTETRRRIKVDLPQMPHEEKLHIQAYPRPPSQTKHLTITVILRDVCSMSFVNQKGDDYSHVLMFLQVIMSQLCTAVHIMYPHVLRAVSSAAIQLFAQDDSDHSSSTSVPLVNSQQPTLQWWCVQVMQIYCLFKSVFAQKHFLLFFFINVVPQTTDLKHKTQPRLSLLV